MHNCVTDIIRDHWIYGLECERLGRIECFHSRRQHLCKFIGTKESVCIRKEFNSQRISLGHQHGRRHVIY